MSNLAVVNWNLSADETSFGFTGLVHQGRDAYLAQDVDEVALFQAQLVLVRGIESEHDLAVLLS